MDMAMAKWKLHMQHLKPVQKWFQLQHRMRRCGFANGGISGDILVMGPSPLLLLKKQRS